MLLFLGLLGLLVFIHFELAKKVHLNLQNLNLRWINVESDKLKDWFLPSIGLGFLSMEPLHNFEVQSSLWRSQVWSLRRYLFSVSQTHFGFAGVLLVLMAFFEINSLFFISILIPLWILAMAMGNVVKNLHWLKILKQIQEIGLFFLLLLYTFEQVFKLTNIIIPFMEETGLVFFLTDTNWLNLAVLLLVGFILSFALPITGFSFYLAFFLYTNSQISFLGGMSLLYGEMISYYFKMFLFYTRMDTTYYLQVKGLFKYLFLSTLVSFGILFFAKFELSVFQSYGDLPTQKWLFIVSCLFVIFSYFFTFMLWGHFNFEQPDPDVKLTDAQLKLEGLKNTSPMVYGYLAAALDLRLKKLQEFQLELNDENKKKIPLFVLKKFDNEKEILTKLLG
jgi:hypothetical protein